jgi:hypothetical protein
MAAGGMNRVEIRCVAEVVERGPTRLQARQEGGTLMADLRVDYQLLASIHSTLNGLTWEFENIEDQASAYDSAYGSSGITAAMGSFAGNWSYHRKTLLGTMQNLDQMVTATAQQFRQTDSQLASELTKK